MMDVVWLEEAVHDLKEIGRYITEDEIGLNGWFDLVPAEECGRLAAKVWGEKILKGAQMIPFQQSELHIDFRGKITKGPKILRSAVKEAVR